MTFSLAAFAEALDVPPIQEGFEISTAELNGMALMYAVFPNGEQLEMYTDPPSHWAQEDGDVVIETSDKGLKVGGPFSGETMVPLASLEALADTWPEGTYPALRRHVMQALAKLKTT